MTQPVDRWWLCPYGTCPHGRILHDGDGADEPFMCCAEGCRCGQPEKAEP